MKNKKALFIGYVWPEPVTTAAGHRMIQLLNALKKNYEITFASTAQQTRYTVNLDELGITTEQIQLNHPSFNDFIENLQPDVVVFDRFMIEEQFGWRVVAFAPNAIRILNTEDLHSLRQTREACHKSKEDFNFSKWKKNEITKREIASIYRCDLSLIISNEETKLLKNVFDISENFLLTLPFLIDPITEEQHTNWLNFETKKDFLFVGNGKHAPNIAAIKHLKTKLWPLIKEKLPTTKLYIYGAYLPQQITEMNKPEEGFLVKGWLADIDSTMQKARLNLAPLLFGAGVKGKIIDGMRNGTPTLTTTIGAEGIPNFNSIYDTTPEFVKQAVRLYSNKAQWLKEQKHNLDILHMHFSKEELQQQLTNTLNTISDSLEQHRSHNFIGSLLQHQTMASTKFMSKWIEEKNKTSI